MRLKLKVKFNVPRKNRQYHHNPKLNQIQKLHFFYLQTGVFGWFLVVKHSLAALHENIMGVYWAFCGQEFKHILLCPLKPGICDP